MGNILKKADILGSEFTLNFGRRERLRTPYGGCLTFAAVGILLIAAYIFLSKLFDSGELEINVSTEFSEKYPKMSMLESAIYPIFYINTKTEGLVPHVNMPNYVSIFGEIEKTNVKNLVGDDFETEVIAFFPFVPCDEAKSKAKELIYGNKTEIRELGENFGVCPEIEDEALYYVQGDITDAPYTVFKIYIYPCQLDDETGCAPEEAIRGAVITTILPKISFDPKNYQNPIKVIPTVDTERSIHPSNTLVTKFKLQTTEIYDDARDFFDPSLRKRYYDIGNAATSIKDRNQPSSAANLFCDSADITEDGEGACEPFMFFQFNSGGSKKKIIRKYQKLIATFGELGGTKEFILISVGFLYFLYTCKATDRYVKGRVLRETPEDLEKFSNLDSRLSKDDKRKKMEQAVEELILQRQDGIHLFASLNKLALFDQVLLKDYDRALLPLALVNHNATLLENKKPEVDLDEEDIHLTEIEEESISLPEAFKKLKESEPDNDLQKAIKQFLLKNLPKDMDLNHTLDAENDMSKIKIADVDDEEYKTATMGKESGKIPEINPKGIDIGGSSKKLRIGKKGRRASKTGSKRGSKIGSKNFYVDASEVRIKPKHTKLD